MKAYWDSSALIDACLQEAGRKRLMTERGFSRLHTLSEVFSTLTGKAHLRMPAGKAAIMVEDLAADLDFVELSQSDILQAQKDAEALGVRGGRIHDLLHARAALKSGAKSFVTLDRNDFENLLPGMRIEQI